MEISKLTEAKRNLDKMKSAFQDFQREMERNFREMDSKIRDMNKLGEETSRYIADAENELRRVENK